ncbi:MAG: VOC family protein [Pseudomonadota bacterium]
MLNKIDHIAIGADSLEQGESFVKSRLGVEIPRGSKHDAMSTHNCVVQAGNESFLEVIAIDPEAPDPGRTRWFTLDDAATRARLSVSPGALCWVVGTDNLDAVLEASPIDLGPVVTFTRGKRSWRLTVPDDGSLPESGLIPAFIEWSPGPHPSSGMQNLALTLQGVRLLHPEPEYIRAILHQLSIDHLATVETANSSSLEFQFQSPLGAVSVDSR